MADTMTPEQRHKCMAAVKGKDTKPEMLVRRYIHVAGYRYGLHNKNLPGKPDIVLRRLKTVIFIHGCFWHGHENCKYFRLPKSDVKFWETKFNRNRERDTSVVRELKSLGWRVIVIWECELKTKEKREKTLKSLVHQLSHIENDTYHFYHYPDAKAAESEVPYGKI